MSDSHAEKIPNDRKYMEQAIEELKKSEDGTPCVGAVLVLNGQIVSVGHRMPGTHAERAAVEAAKAQGVDLHGSTIYTTLEPCVTIGPNGRESCAALIARVGVSTVVIGRFDPNPKINRKGWKTLRDAGLKLRDFDADLREKIDCINSQFVGYFESGVGPIGSAKFDYTLNEGHFKIAYSTNDQRSITTGWALAGKRAIHAAAAWPVKVALARYATEFAEIDDPSALDLNTSIRVEEGQIIAFISNTGCVLVKVLEVHSGPRFGSDHTSLKFQYEVRVLAHRGT